jgi:phage-related protein
MFQSSLRDKKIISIIETKNEFFNRYQSSTFNGETFTLDFTAPEITELIQNGKIINPEMSVIIALYQALNFQTILLAPIYDLLYQGLNWITETLRKYLEFQDYNWDPEAQKDGTANENFQPAIFSVVGNISDAAEQNADEIVAAIKKAIDQKEQDLRSQINIVLNPPIPGFVWPDSLKNFVTSALDSVSRLKQNLYYAIDGIVSFMLYIGEKWLNVVNAFYCGLWNSVVEIFVGMIDMVKFVFLLLSTIGDAVSNAQTLIPEMLETMDEFMQLITGGEFLDTLIAAIQKVAEKIPEINLWSLTNSISIERVGYFLGNIGGFIMELILDAFYSGGIKGVEDLITKFGTLGKNVSEAFLTTIKKIVKSPTGFTAETISKCTSFIIGLLKQGKEKVLQWIDDFWNVLVEAAKLGEDVVTRIRKIFSYTEEQVQSLRTYGLDFVKFEEQGAKSECSVCRILNY